MIRPGAPAGNDPPSVPVTGRFDQDLHTARSETEVSSRRTFILVGALVIGGLAAFLTLNYVRGVENESASQNQLVEVLVAKGPLPRGTSADVALASDQITMAKRRRADLPVNAVRRNAEIAGQVAAVELGGGEIITSNMFVADSELSGSKSTSLDKGNVAITISVDQAAGVAGLVQPGDSINILATVTPEEGDGGLTTAGATQGEGGFRISRPAVYAFQDVKVLAVGQNLGQPVASDSSDEASAPQEFTGLITVQLPPEDAALLAGLRDSSLYLTLNRPDYEPAPVPFRNWVGATPGITGSSPYNNGQ
jgi:pilus assembly protein CpaB